MLFNSIEYLIFFPLVVAIYFSIAPKRRWAVLLAASYFFYMYWKPSYALLLVTSTVVDYVAALRMGAMTDRRSRRPYLVLSLASNLGLLFAFKYLGFFTESARSIATWLAIPQAEALPHVDWLLPVGISFYTFQTLGYAIDVYRGDRPPERHLGIFALYVSFFPQLVAGPIERSTRLLPQFRRLVGFDIEKAKSGAALIVWGLFKKIVIADHLALIVDRVYADPQAFAGPGFVVATIFFAFQIYCDFSGYADIAVGSARVMGFDLMANFDRPYVSRSASEFWRRWHISLSTWFRDYLYLPLGGNRVAIPRWYANLFIVFLISGLWHGANWTFVVWGAFHGALLIISHLISPYSSRIVDFLGLKQWKRTLNLIALGRTFSLVCIGWVFFRATDMFDALYILKNLAVGWDGLLNPEHWVSSVMIDRPFEFVLGVISIVLLELAQWLRSQGALATPLFHQPIWIRWPAVYALLIAILVLYTRSGAQQFIYFQF